MTYPFNWSGLKFVISLSLSLSFTPAICLWIAFSQKWDLKTSSNLNKMSFQWHFFPLSVSFSWLTIRCLPFNFVLKQWSSSLIFFSKKSSFSWFRGRKSCTFLKKAKAGSFARKKNKKTFQVSFCIRLKRSRCLRIILTVAIFNSCFFVVAAEQLKISLQGFSWERKLEVSEEAPFWNMLMWICYASSCSWFMRETKFIQVYLFFFRRLTTATTATSIVKAFFLRTSESSVRRKMNFQASVSWMDSFNRGWSRFRDIAFELKSLKPDKFR